MCLPSTEERRNKRTLPHFKLEMKHMFSSSTFVTSHWIPWQRWEAECIKRKYLREISKAHCLPSCTLLFLGISCCSCQCLAPEGHCAGIVGDCRGYPTEILKSRFLSAPPRAQRVCGVLLASSWAQGQILQKAQCKVTQILLGPSRDLYDASLFYLELGIPSPWSPWPY